MSIFYAKVRKGRAFVFLNTFKLKTKKDFAHIAFYFGSSFFWPHHRAFVRTKVEHGEHGEKFERFERRGGKFEEKDGGKNAKTTQAPTTMKPKPKDSGWF